MKFSFDFTAVSLSWNHHKTMAKHWPLSSSERDQSVCATPQPAVTIY